MRILLLPDPGPSWAAITTSERPPGSSGRSAGDGSASLTVLQNGEKPGAQGREIGPIRLSKY
jgi:hypothetical protein